MDQWEFDAPQFVDFTQPDIHDDGYADTWFDRHTENDDFVRLSKEGDDAKTSGTKKPQRVLRSTGGTRQPESGKVEIMDTNCKSPRYLNAKPARVLVGEKHVSQTNMKSLCPSPMKRQKTSTEDQCVDDSVSNNVAVQSSSANHSEATVHNDCPATNTRLRSPIGVNSKLQHAVLLSPKRNLETVVSPRETGAIKKIEISTSKQTVNSTTATVTKPDEKLIKVKRSQSLKSVMPSKAGSLAKLNNPEHSVLDSSSKETTAILDASSVTKKTSEQLELEAIAAMKQEVARTRRLAQDSYKKAMSNHSYVPMRSSQPATIAVGFNFKTDERIKNPDVHAQEHKVKNFTASLREALPQPALPSRPQVHGLTRPQPFKLASAKSTSSLTQAEKYESVAERVIAFHRKTPDRFRSNPHGPKERSRSTNKNDALGQTRRLRSQSPKLTIAKTPTLTARGRTRPVNVISREEKEQVEFEEHQKQQFKAHPVNPKVFDAPTVPKVQPKPLTVVEEFNLHSQKSASISDLMDAVEDANEKYEFHARPVNPKILAGPVGVKPVEPKPTTVPESPAFALKNRVRLPVEMPEKVETKESVKANPVPYSGIPFKPRLGHHFTVPEPFAVEERSREMLTRKDQKIQQYLEEEKKAREFYAQEIPKESPDALPPKMVKPATQPEPFHLVADDRGEKYKRDFKLKLEEEEKLAHDAANFKAGPNNVIHKEPFQTLKSGKPLTERNSFTMNTDYRAAQREAFDQHIKAREAELEALKRQREERLQREEEAAIARMRTQAVHKASGIKRYKSVIVKPSDKPPTEAQSPRFSQRVRSKQNNSNI